MRTLVSPSRGRVSVIERPRPEAVPGTVLIEVAAASLNPVDAMVVSGMFHDLGLIGHSDSLGLGWDAVGRVAAVGTGVSGFAAGARVATVHGAIDTPAGTLAEYVAVPADAVAHIPDGLADLDAATVGLNALTAAQALDLLGEPAGRTLLVTGAAGAVGGYAVELASLSGWTVTGLARESDRDFVTRTGATLVTELPAGPQAPAFDAVLDAAPLQLDEALFRGRLIPALAASGSFVGVMGALPLPELPGRSVHAVTVHGDGPQLEALLELAAAGSITPRLLGMVPLAGARDAVAATAAGGRRGRWVVSLQD